MRLLHNKPLHAITLISALFVSSELCAQERLSASDTFTERTKEFLSDPSRTGSLVGSILVGAAVANPLAPLLGSVAGFMIGKSSAFSNNDSNAARRQAYGNRSLVTDDGNKITQLSGLTGKSLQADGQTAVVGWTGETEVEMDVGMQLEQSEPTLAAALPGEPPSSAQLARIRETAPVEYSEKMELPNRLGRSEQILFVELPEEEGRANQSERLEQTVALDITGNTAMGSDIQKRLARACSNMQISQPMSLSCYYHSQ